MKKNLLLNAELSHLIATLGHGDMLVLGDAGLPIPVGPTAPQRIDLAVSPGTPRLAEVLKAVLSEMQVQSTLIATEALKGDQPPAWYAEQLSLAPKTVSHEEFKKICAGARAMVRTGECSPYANVILVSGVTF
jgi:D-ribose pyranase